MKSRIDPMRLTGVWSATPTPFTEKMQTDVVATKRMVDHHLRLGVGGLFLAGSCGEGAFMPEREKRRLVQTVVDRAAGRLVIAVQVTDNSAARILDNVEAAKSDGADIAVIAPPNFLPYAKPDKVLNLYLEAVRNSPMPIGIYDRGAHSSVPVPEGVLKQVYHEENVVLVKDSSTNAARRDLALAVRRKRPELRLLTGYEFGCVEYLKAGYDGLLLGGGIFNGYLAGKIIEAVRSGDLGLAEKLQQRMNRMMYDVYGGKKIACWLSGLKKLLVDMGIFRTWRNFPDYPLTPSCIRAIQRVLAGDADVLLP